MPRQAQRHTIYDVMDNLGVFDRNPANFGAQDEAGNQLYVGPVEYPKMLYHPKGEQRVTEPEKLEPTPIGPVRVPARYEMISAIAENAEAEAALRAEGWHDHPAKAISAAGGKAPPMGAAQVLSDKDRRIAELEAQLAAMAGGTADADKAPAPTTAKKG